MSESSVLCERRQGLHSRLALDYSAASYPEPKRAQMKAQRSSETGCEGEARALKNSSLALFSALTFVDISLLAYLLVPFLQTLCLSAIRDLGN